ncbi:hypothetical protein CANCADRAFT_129586 [Tortispora caseinolytica NRRL Y-17796]|uniref:Dihydroxyacetone kinase n=1 Tax=Tortispora caseinolytica NRRL Y-17796 TaxID=767744 RepID=A0A1E4TAR1_9ASCO|nr:hypothetical protein CANCADRAFT_129586 [Tortispora caseinolytica NRRL Y-17796]
MSSGKHFDTTGQDLIGAALKSVLRQNPDVSLLEADRVLFRRPDPSTPKVTLLSGGGSGHEPIHGGFVGYAGLDAAVAGALFASPSSNQVTAGLKAIASPKGTLIIVKNYTGDIIHFGLAAERAKARGQNIRMVIVTDDTAVGRKQGGLVGRRGLAGTVLVHKCAGALAAAGADLDAVANLAQAVIDNTATIGASLDHCTIPGRAHNETELLKADQMEIGMGIHNEPGIKHLSPIPTVPDLVSQLLPYILDTSDEDRAFVKFDSSDEIVLLVNNLGGLSALEFGGIVEATVQLLKSKYSIAPVRVYAGPFITALNGEGFSITLLNATKASEAASTSVLDLLDAPCGFVGWNNFVSPESWKTNKFDVIKDSLVQEESGTSSNTASVPVDSKVVEKALSGVVDNLISAEPKITRYDTIAGDGDCGETLKDGALAISKALKDKSIDTSNLFNTVYSLTHIVEESMGGTSGGLYAIFLSALAGEVAKIKGDVSSKEVGKASKAALDALFKYTKARPGHRTLIDALVPFVDALANGDGIKAAASAAEQGAESTKQLEAKFGRASYVSREELASFDNEGGIPDPGAVGVAELAKGIASAF